MKHLKKLANNGRGVFEANVEEYMKTKPKIPYTIQDLYRAYIDGCNVVSVTQHDSAIPLAEAYIAKKSSDVVYSVTHIELAFREGAKAIAQEWEKTQVKISVRNTEKAAKLICACSQLMSLADNFNKEAERLMSNSFTTLQIKNEYTEIKDMFKGLSDKFKVWNEQCSSIFLGLSIDDNFKWGEENEKLEYAVRKVMKIDR